MSAVLRANWVPLDKWGETGRPWPNTDAQWRAILRKRGQNGLDKCVAKVGRTLLIDEDKFVEWIAEHVKAGGAR